MKDILLLYLKGTICTSAWEYKFNLHYSHLDCIPKAMVGWERRMRIALTEREALNALEHLRIEIQVHGNSQLCVKSL